MQLFPLLHFPLYVCVLPEQLLCIIARKPFVFCLAPKSKFSVCISSPGHDRTYVMGSFLRQMHTLSLWVLLLPPLPSLFSQNVQTVCPELLRKFLLYFLLRNAPKDLPITATATAAATALKRLVCLPSVFIFFIKTRENLCFIRCIFPSFYVSILSSFLAIFCLSPVTANWLPHLPPLCLSCYDYLSSLFHSCLFAPVVDASL